MIGVRFKRWEFWPPWAAYAPVIPYLVWLAIRHRSLTVFTAANPGIFTGGLRGESKSSILRHLPDAAEFHLVPGALGSAARIQAAHDFMSRHRLDYPVVLKPDVGERGRDVSIIRSTSELAAYLRRAEADVILQRYIAGEEFGLFYYRYPDQDRGRILSITKKRFPAVTGDGISSIAALIRNDPRAANMMAAYEKQCRRSMDSIPDQGERVPLVEIGSHCRGAVFLNGAHLLTHELEASIDLAAKAHPGFFFGRFDVRAESEQALCQGRFRVLELNGVGSEATHIYDPSVSLLEAYRVLFRQWSVAFSIGAANRLRGFLPTPLRILLNIVTGKARGSNSSRSARTNPSPGSPAAAQV